MNRGLTLIELIVAMAVAAALFAAVVTSVGAITGSKARAAAGELGGTIRSVYDTASLTGKTCRLAFQLPDFRDDEARVKYWAECAAGNLTVRRDRDEMLKDEAKRERQREKRADRPRETSSPTGEPTLEELMAQERERVENAAKYSNYTAPEIQPRELPNGVKLSIWTRHQRDAVGTGIAYLYFFPQGFTERAMVFVKQGSNVWTLTVSPLTGKTAVVGEQLEIPRS